MALNLEKVKEINPKRKSTVYGFVRKQYENDVPDGVILICLLFYGYYSDKWDKDNMPKCLQLDEDKAMLTHMNDTNTGEGVSAYLTEKVSSGVHAWKFKVIKCAYDQFTTMHVGLWDVNKNDGKPPINSVFKEQGYAFATSKGQKWTSPGGYVDWGQKCPDGTIIDMTVNFDDLSLSFMINGRDYYKSHNIKPGTYRAAVYLYCNKDSIQLIEKY